MRGCIGRKREREGDEERGMEPRGMETHTCTVVNIVPDRYESQCAVYQTAILPTLDTLVVGRPRRGWTIIFDPC